MSLAVYHTYVRILLFISAFTISGSRDFGDSLLNEVKALMKSAVIFHPRDRELKFVAFADELGEDIKAFTNELIARTGKNISTDVRGIEYPEVGGMNSKCLHLSILHKNKEYLS